jgi:hypothetical protein
MNEKALVHWGLSYKKKTNKPLFIIETHLYATFYALLLLSLSYVLIYFLYILSSETLYKLKKEDQDTAEQIYYVNKKRHTLLTLGRSSELKKGK